MLTRKSFMPRKRAKARSFDPKRCEPYLRWLRRLPCVLDGRGGCSGRIVAAHVDYAGDKGMATKVSDRYAVPMCDGHHTVQHGWGWKSFESNFRIDTLELSKAYYDEWLKTPAGREWEREHDTSGS